MADVEQEEQKIFDGQIVNPHSDYTINHKKFIHILRVNELKKLIEHKIDKQALIISSLFLDDSNYIDKSEVFEETESLSFSQIHSKLEQLKEKYEGKLLC